MGDNKTIKHTNLKKAGLFNQHHEKVTDPLFFEYPYFFDPCDTIQVHYEMLRAQLIEKHTVSGICKRFGLSRQSFYAIQEKFKQEGTAGLIPKKPGPQGPSKLTEEVLECIQKHLHRKEEKISTGSIKTEIEDRFGISLHRRTVEKVCKKLRVKKKFQ